MYHIPTMNAPDISLSNRPTQRQSAIPSPFVLNEVEGPVLSQVEGPQNRPPKEPVPHVTL